MHSLDQGYIYNIYFTVFVWSFLNKGEINTLFAEMGETFI